MAVDHKFLQVRESQESVKYINIAVVLIKGNQPGGSHGRQRRPMVPRPGEGAYHAEKKMLSTCKSMVEDGLCKPC